MHYFETLKRNVPVSVVSPDFILLVRVSERVGSRYDKKGKFSFARFTETPLVQRLTVLDCGSDLTEALNHVEVFHNTAFKSVQKTQSERQIKHSVKTDSFC